MAGPALTEPPAAKLQRMFPFAALMANIVGLLGSLASDAPYTTPLATLTAAGAMPSVTGWFRSGSVKVNDELGSRVRHRMAPVLGSMAPHEPPMPSSG